MNISAEALRVEGEISQLEKEWTAIYAKAAKIDWLEAHMKSVETFSTFIELAVWNGEERVYYRGSTLEDAIKAAMEAEPLDAAARPSA